MLIGYLVLSRAGQSGNHACGGGWECWVVRVGMAAAGAFVGKMSAAVLAMAEAGLALPSVRWRGTPSDPAGIQSQTPGCVAWSSRARGGRTTAFRAGRQPRTASALPPRGRP